MRVNTAFCVLGVLTGTILLVGFWGCGTGPIEQSYAIQSHAKPVSSSAIIQVSEKSELPDLMKEMRTANLNLEDRLTSGTPEQVVRAAVQVSLLAKQTSTYEPAIAKEGREEAAAFKRLAHQVQDMAVEVAKAMDGGQPGLADQYYVRLLLTCNQCHRLFRGAAAPTEPLPIPELETPKPPETPPEGGTGETPAPGPVPLPGPTEPLPAPPE